MDAPRRLLIFSQNKSFLMKILRKKMYFWEWNFLSRKNENNSYILGHGTFSYFKRVLKKNLYILHHHILHQNYNNNIFLKTLIAFIFPIN